MKSFSYYSPEDLLVIHTPPTLLFCDNQAAIHIVANLIYHARTENRDPLSFTKAGD